MVTLWIRYRRPLVTGLTVLTLVLVLMGILATGSSERTDHHTSNTHSPNKPPAPSALPLGGRTLFPNYSLIALYGSPNEPALGALGEQSLDQSISRAKQLAADYQPYISAGHAADTSHVTAMPALELIATVASASPTMNNDYSREMDVATLRPWVETAQKAGVYIMLDLQPGRSDFLTQAKEYADLLKLPNVGLALDPEWRLKPDQVHLAQIGSVDVAEINQTSAWLADLTATYNLPQKLLLIHQFRIDMITNRAALDTSRNNLAYVIQMDGSGSQAQKQATWQVITKDAPVHCSFGWKNFYSKDTPMLSPQETMTISPVPNYVSYQ